MSSKVRTVPSFLSHRLATHELTDQDARLDHLSSSIHRQHHISLQINDELDVHTGLLGELDTELDGTQARMAGARRRLARVARGAKENGASRVFWIGERVELTRRQARR